MKIALLGYGKMGKAIEAFSQDEKNHQVVAKLDESNATELSTQFLETADVAIDFSNPNVAVDHITTCFKAGVPVVSGTTGWLDRWSEIEKQQAAHNGGLFYSSNFSVGVNLFWKIVAHATQLMSETDYAIDIEETHHIQKIDAPSGTAITTAERVLENHLKYKKWHLGETNQEGLLQILAHRVDDVPGTHLVNFENYIDEISIQHRAKSRRGFVKGAVLAAEFMVGKTGFYNMDDLLDTK